MRIEFLPEATDAQRTAVREALGRLGVGFAEEDGGLALSETPAEADATSIAALAGVASIGPSHVPANTVRDSIHTWTMGAATVLGLLSIAAAALPASLGTHADPLRTPSPLRPSWPLLAWYAAVDKAPSWLPVPLLFLLAALLLFFWPDVARRLAQSRPALHAALGAAALLAVLGLLAMELGR
jgi:quinol-cytochrome oxidoreductase complex cytochrome b subunit